MIGKLMRKWAWLILTKHLRDSVWIRSYSSQVKGTNFIIQRMEDPKEWG